VRHKNGETSAPRFQLNLVNTGSSVPRITSQRITPCSSIVGYSDFAEKGEFERSGINTEQALRFKIKFEDRP
jgi:hypothetical protein